VQPACHKGVRAALVAPLADATSPPAVSRSAPAVVPRLAATGLAPSPVPAGPSLPGAASAPGKPRARPSQIPATSAGNDGGGGPRYTSPILDVVGKSGGQSLDPTTRVDMEARLGADFSAVRVHTGDQAARSAAAISATAYTLGSDVVFGQGSFDPASHQDRHRLAHELVHVQQQRHGPVSGTDSGGGVVLSDPADSLEREAEAIAARVMASPQRAGGRGLRGGHQGRPSTRWTGARAVQRCGGLPPCDCATGEEASVHRDSADAPTVRAVRRAALTPSHDARHGDQIPPHPGTTTQPGIVQRQAVSTHDSRMPQDAALSFGPQIGPLGSTPGGFDPTQGDPVPGYEHSRKVYTDADRAAMIKKVNEREKENNGNVMAFAGDFSASIAALWGTHLTDQMSRAAAARAMVNWAKLTEAFLEEAMITVLGMGLGHIAKLTAEVFFKDHVKHLITEKVVEVFGETALKTGNESAKGKLEQDEIEKTQHELDEKTPKIANIVTELHTNLVDALNIPWADYGAWLTKGRLDQLATFRLPKIFARVDKDKIRTAAAGAIVTALHESHTNDEPPSRIGMDPTERDETSYFDDFQIISHLHIDELGALSEESTEVYVRNSSPLLNQLKGKPIGLMGQIPLFVAIAEHNPQVHDGATAYRIMGGVQKEASLRYGSSVVWRESEAELFVRLYPRERELRITRSPKSATEGSEESSGHVAVRGGGLGEHLMLLQWALGLDWEIRIIGEITDRLGDVVKRDYPRQDETGSGLGDFPVRETVPIAQQILEFWMEPGAEALISKYVVALKPDVPENRWDKDYFDKGTRRQILKR
jgi:hypothetical protein